MDVSRISPHVAPLAAPAVRPAAPRAATQPAAPAAGSSLWDLLTPEEQDFFTRQTALGALTYGRASKNSAPPTPQGAPLGGRIDVKG